MLARPYISICIPAYRNPQHLTRLLDSIKIQSFQDYEIVITDDSPDDSIYELVNDYQKHFPIRYVKNDHPKGSPENWNASIKLAKGEWIKIMHDDDWFAHDHALQEFYTAAKSNKSDFIFSGYSNVNLIENVNRPFLMSAFVRWLLSRYHLLLFKRNYIGHPSTTMIKNNLMEWFDPTIKWVVDFEFYLRLLHQKKDFIYLSQSLINIGMGPHQITREVFRKKEVEIPENIYLLNKLGTSCLNNIFVYDYYWRLFRNLEIVDIGEVKELCKEMCVPEIINVMILRQVKIGVKKLQRNRFQSKFHMFLSYLQFTLNHTSARLQCSL